MSERWGPCRSCKGKGTILTEDAMLLESEVECGLCHGTGFDGGADRYMQREINHDWEAMNKPYERPIYRGDQY